MEPLAEPYPLGRYLLVAELGRGAMGVVYLAIGSDSVPVALKQVRPQYLDIEDFRSRFRHEVEACREVSSLHTAAVLDADVDADLPWLVSEFIHGPTLDKAIGDAGSLSADAALRLARGLVLALSDIHETGLVHRDLKPSNVLLADEGPRVIDFGIARATEHDGGTEVTHTSWLAGSPPYMSPEQAEGQVLTTASDMFSLATILYKAVTGTNPFDRRGTPQTMYAVVNTEPDLDVLDPRIRAVVEPCWSKDPQARPDAPRLLELIGDLPETARPWPDEVHAQTERQRTQVVGLVPAAPAVPPLHDDQTWVMGAGPGGFPPPQPVRASHPNPVLIGGIVIAALLGIAVLLGAIGVVGTVSANSGSIPETTSDEPTTAEEEPLPEENDPGYDDTDEPYDDPTTPAADDIAGAVAGDCVYGSSDEDSDWYIEPCETGNFTVSERIDDTGDLSECDDVESIDWSVSDGSVVLCLYMNYPDDAGYADKDNCLDKSGPDDEPTFTFADCDAANVYVTGRSNTYNDSGFCGNHGWTTWEQPDFPELSYTMCWQWL